MEKRKPVIIFVVDDDLPSYQLIEELFSEHQVTLKHFTEGSELIKILSNGEIPDLVIMDILLPDIDGLEVTKQIKRMDPGIPVIAYTSYAMPGDRERCLQSGCDDYLSKPVDVRGFIQTVSNYL